MTSGEFLNIYKLVTEHNLEIDNEQVPGHLKCVQCKSILKDACRLQCGCAFCSACVADLMVRGAEFCPGRLSEACGTSYLAEFYADHSANKSISALVVRCSKSECPHMCQLIDMEDHLRLCSRNRVKCPFSEFGCRQDSFSPEEMNAHLQLENRCHSEIWIEMFGRINNEFEMLKRENKSIKSEYKSIQDENKSIKDQNKLIMEENKSMGVEIKSIKDENKSIKDENKSIRDQIELIQHKIMSMGGEIESVRGEMTWISDDARSVKCEIAGIDSAIKPMENKIESIRDKVKLVNSDIRSIKRLVGQVDCSLVWVIKANLLKSNWELADRSSHSFTGDGYPYEYRLFSSNGGFFYSRLQIQLVVQPCEDEVDIDWPFKRQVVIIVSDTDRPNVCHRISRQCRIGRPQDNESRVIDLFEFSHSELVDVSVDLSRGVRVTCLVVLDCS